ncbi:hypothetical protein BRC91_01800 [Halobacteriales archaeon QS_4_62_28]|nr:MAG: hypothetical protein BRC91_01800 [Halobacteriales archaeon QS_4_62_28]
MSSATPVHVGIVGGTRLPGNVRTFLNNLKDLLETHSTRFELTLLLQDEINVPEGYNDYDPGFDQPGRAINTLKTLTSGITQYARSNQIDLLFQVTKFPLHGCATTIAGQRTDTPVVTRFAGDNFREFRFSSGMDRVKTFGLNNVIGRVPIQWSDRVIVLGPYGRSEIAKRADNVQIVEIPQPVDREQFSPVPVERERELSQEVGFPTSKRVLLTVGRLTKRKGIPALIKAAETLYDRGKPFRWYVLGEGPMREEIKATHGVKPLGRVDFTKIADYYRAADLVVHPSLIEGLPNVLLESAACGTPTVARDVGDCSLVASATFEKTTELPELLTQDYDPIALGERFNPDRLRKQYANSLVETAKQI